MHKTINLTNIGPIAELSLPIPDGGGLIVIRGKNDSGKSTAIRAVGRIMGGDGDVSCRDDCKRGEAEGLGVTVTVQKSVRRSGELEAVAIEGKLSVADLVDPGIDDPEKADLRRIRALIQISGVKADLWQFAGVLPGGETALKEIASAKAMQATDLVEMAAELKRNLEAAARKEADEANKEAGAALGCREAIEGLDLSAAVDGNALQAQHTAAVQEHATLESQARSYRRAVKARQEAEQKLAESAGEYRGHTVAEAETRWSDEVRLRDDLQSEVNDLEQQLDRRKAELRMAKLNASNAADMLVAAQAHEKALADANTALAMTLPTAPDQDAIDAAADCVQEARQAIEHAAVIRRAIEKAKQADKHEAAAKAHREKAESLRDAAKSTDEVLSAAVDSEALFVRSGRLMTTHQERGPVPYHERSQGTRWRLAIDEACKRIRQFKATGTAVIPLPQEAFECLDPENRRIIAEHAKERGVVIITAEAADGELRAEVEEGLIEA